MTDNRLRPAAANSLQLIKSWREWIDLQSESLEWQSAVTVRRRVVVDFVLPETAFETTAARAGIFVPLGFVAKGESAARPIARDEGGRLVPTLGRDRSTQLAQLILAEGAESLAEPLKSLLVGIPGATPDDAAARIEKLGNELLIAVKAGATYDPDILRLATHLVTNYLLFIEVDRRGSPHRVMSFEYELPVSHRRRGLRDIPQMLGWTATSIWAEVSASGRATYEVTVTAPEGTEISVAQLVLFPEYGESVATATANAVVAGTFVGPGTRPSARLSVGGVTSGRAFLRVDLAPSRAYILGVLVTAVFAAAILTVGFERLPQIITAVDASTALLLAGPTLFAALVARPRRGGPGTQLLAAARMVLLLTGLLTFLAAGTLVTTKSLPHLHEQWRALAIVAWVSSAILLVSVLSPGAALRARRARTRQARPHATGKDILEAGSQPRAGRRLPDEAVLPRLFRAWRARRKAEARDG